MCLLNKNVSIEWKGVYWQKMCLLTENVPTEWKKYLLTKNVSIKGS